jgi:nucleotide-binding universal stress UspA family protein
MQYPFDYPLTEEALVYKQIMVPVDLAHIAKLEKALKTAADLSKLYRSPVCYIAVTAATPGSIAHNPAEFAERLEAFGRKQAEIHGHNATTKAYMSHDPAVDLNDTLLAAVNEVGADLVVMASHIPGLVDYVWPSHGGKIASHSAASVFLVR